MAMGCNAAAATMIAAAMVMLAAMVMVPHPVHAVIRCTGNELQNVVGSCSNAVFSHILPAFNSGCCQSLRSVNKPCLCSQVNTALKGQSVSSFISPQIAKGIRQNCNVGIPQGCPGFGSR